MNITPDSSIAFIFQPLPQFQGAGGYLELGMRALCKTKRFIPGEEQPGYDLYVYIDDGPTYYMEPKYHPAVYWAIDMVVKPFWYLEPVERYFRRLQNFDFSCVSSTATQAYCQERGLDVKLLGFAADLNYHRVLDFPKDLDWVAAWHNCEGRVEASKRAQERFPQGEVVWAGDGLYAAYINRGRCSLNWLRGDIVNMRVFEILACRTPLITTRHPDMQVFGLSEGEHYRGYDPDDIQGMLDQIAWCLEHKDEAEQMAVKGWYFVREHHTYYQRAKELLEWLPDVHR